MHIGSFQGYPIYVSDRKNKKYYALVNGKKIHFGDNRYQQYHDVMGHYKKLDHNDKERRNRYYQRHGVNAKEGTAHWFSNHVLWPI
jgi:hypothetical protein